MTCRSHRRVCDVENPFTGRTVARQTKRMDVRLAAQETQWYLLR